MRKIIFAIAATLLTPACSSILAQKKAEIAPTQLGKENTEALTMPGQLRAIMIRKRDGKTFVCAEPAPDVAMSDTFKLVTALSLERSANINASTDESSSASEKGSASNDLQATTTALQLAGRTQTVLLAREFLFRTCEAAANNLINEGQVYESHQQILLRISEMVSADEKASTAASIVSASVAMQNIDPKVVATTKSIIDSELDAQCMKAFRACMTAAKGAAAGDSCEKTFKTCME